MPSQPDSKNGLSEPHLGAAQPDHIDLARSYAVTPLTAVQGVFTCAPNELIASDETQRQFISKFFSCSNQSAEDQNHTLLLPTASLAYLFGLQILRTQFTDIALPHPTFGRFADIARSVGLRLVPIRDTPWLDDQPFTETSGVDVVIAPSQPHGLAPDAADFDRYIRRAKALGKTLILDLTWRFFSNLNNWDQYEILRRHSVAYIAIEDTGKTWPSGGSRVALVSASSHLFERYLHFARAVVRPPPSTLLNGIAQMIEETQSLGADMTIKETALKNRDLLATIDWSPHAKVLPATNLPAALVQFRSEHLARRFLNIANQVGLVFLPGAFFFWNNPDIGSRLIRISLTLPRNYFLSACERIGRVLKLL